VKKILVALLFAVVSLVPATGALAQSVNCTTLFANGPMPMTNCSTPSGSVNCTTLFADTSMPQTNCSGSGLAPRAAQPPVTTYVPPPPPVPGLDVTFNGKPRHFDQAVLIKGSDGLAIYVVWDQALHAFPTWSEYLKCGGAADLSNVTMVVSVPPALVSWSIPEHTC
jgi:hypothetical protein